MRKFDSKSNVGNFLKYSTEKTFRVLNKRSLVIEELIYVIFIFFYETKNVFQERAKVSKNIEFEESMNKVKIVEARQKEVRGLNLNKKDFHSH